MSFLPCGNAIGFNIDAGDNATTGYSSTVYNTSVIQLDDETSAHVTLEQRNESTVDFKVIHNDFIVDMPFCKGYVLKLALLL